LLIFVCPGRERFPDGAMNWLGMRCVSLDNPTMKNEQPSLMLEIAQPRNKTCSVVAS
jgi:hypothetical protein